MSNQTPEQIARDKIDAMLKLAGWKVQDRKAIDFNAGLGIAVREYPTDIGPADYVLFVDRKPLGVIEAKREEEGHRLTIHESQAEAYAYAQLKYVNNDPLTFIYESTGEITRFTNFRDTKPRARQVFSFHRPETFKEWLAHAKSLRARLLDLPELQRQGLRNCQITAIETLEQSFKDNFPRALIQMVTGSGKTYTAITFIYRLLRFAEAKRILFLVDTKNLGEQAEQEFMAYTPSDDNRKFTELYIIEIVREEFAEGNDFCKKITYRSEEDPKSILAQFRNSYNPRIAVTVNMIATGTDVKPLECLLFMRDVRTSNYFEQMKGRGTRTLKGDDLKKVTPSAKSNKTHFVIVDAVGVTKSLKTDSRPLERKPQVALKRFIGCGFDRFTG